MNIKGCGSLVSEDFANLSFLIKNLDRTEAFTADMVPEGQKIRRMHGQRQNYIPPNFMGDNKS